MADASDVWVRHSRRWWALRQRPGVIAPGAGCVCVMSDRNPSPETEGGTDRNGIDWIADREPPRQGGSKIAICPDCEREVLWATREHLTHRVVCRHRETDGRVEPTRSEPADFGLGESTGVQEL